MITDGLFKVLSAIHPLTTGFKKSLAKELITLSFPKNYILVEEGKIAQYVYFLETGFAMAYSFHDKRKLVEGFWKPGQIMTSAGSFYEQVASTEFIQLAEDSNLLCLSHSGLHRLFNYHQEAHFLYHKIMNNYYRQCRARIHDIQRLSAARRFETLLKSFPDVEQVITQENIASYLAITPQSLSRIKRQREL